ncbi:hypothetical protein K458DRAFT_395297 [Lentithecium fluviatile CBS 122367]|uniref:Uncharacterized protein n=1 Tax=Lentithecium fluviatile CBS 122367 TaxID=1168545 RepID=A0A6G1IIE8_9PLEO|nr:hypothetical protein K458DRAFT_395297 [Lentithecium fluviatile CBS 122367]
MQLRSRRSKLRSGEDKDLFMSSKAEDHNYLGVHTPWPKSLIRGFWQTKDPHEALADEHKFMELVKGVEKTWGMLEIRAVQKKSYAYAQPAESEVDAESEVGTPEQQHGEKNSAEEAQTPPTLSRKRAHSCIRAATPDASPAPSKRICIAPPSPPPSPLRDNTILPTPTSKRKRTSDHHVAGSKRRILAWRESLPMTPDKAAGTGGLGIQTNWAAQPLGFVVNFPPTPDSSPQGARS